MNGSVSPDPMRRFFGWLLFAVGLLMMTLCGLCTLVFMVSGLVSSGGQGLAATAMFIGGIPTAMGLGLFVAGREFLKPRAPAPKPETFD